MAKKKSEDELPLEPDTTTLEAEHTAAAQDVDALKTALAEAEARKEQAAADLAALTAPEPVTGPRIKFEHSGEIVAVEAGQERERRLLINGLNYEHVSDVEDNGETIWVYRQM